MRQLSIFSYRRTTRPLGTGTLKFYCFFFTVHLVTLNGEIRKLMISHIPFMPVFGMETWNNCPWTTIYFTPGMFATVCQHTFLQWSDWLLITPSRSSINQKRAVRTNVLMSWQSLFLPASIIATPHKSMVQSVAYIFQREPQHTTGAYPRPPLSPPHERNSEP